MSWTSPISCDAMGAGDAMTEQTGLSSPPAESAAREAGGTLSTLSGMTFLWPLQFASAMSATTASALRWYSELLAGAANADAATVEPAWTTPNRVSLELPTLRLRDFSNGATGQPALICAPYALHGATIADFAPGHSIVEALRQAGLARLALTEWRSCAPDMRHFSIDTYLADLNVVVDELKPPVDLIGLCQGGWMALVYAARFPEKVRRLVLTGAPVDVRAARSQLMRAVDELPFGAFENLVRIGEGRVLGRYALKLWGSAAAVSDPAQVLQLLPGLHDTRLDALKRRFAEWHSWTVDLPGAYYLQVVQQVFQENQIAEGRFVALGRVIDLGTIRVPMYLLAAGDDEVVDPEQLFAVTRLTKTPPDCIAVETVPCGHLGLFMGADTMAGAWPRIAQWLSRDVRMALAS
jgi:poly(3-hydroxyalkanoate) synthetase